MDKVAVLQEIQESAYNEELDKIAASGGETAKKVINYLKGLPGAVAGAYKKSGQGLASGMKSVGRDLDDALKSATTKQKMYNLKRGAGSAGTAARQGALVLGTGGAALGGAGVGGAMLAGGKKK